MGGGPSKDELEHARKMKEMENDHAMNMLKEEQKLKYFELLPDESKMRVAQQKAEQKSKQEEAEQEERRHARELKKQDAELKSKQVEAEQEERRHARELEKQNAEQKSKQVEAELEERRHKRNMETVKLEAETKALESKVEIIKIRAQRETEENVYLKTATPELVLEILKAKAKLLELQNDKSCPTLTAISDTEDSSLQRKLSSVD